MGDTVRLHFDIDGHQHDIGVNVPADDDENTLELRARVLEAADGVIKSQPKGAKVTKVWLADEKNEIVSEAKEFKDLVWA